MAASRARKSVRLRGTVPPEHPLYERVAALSSDRDRARLVLDWATAHYSLAMLIQREGWPVSGSFREIPREHPSSRADDATTAQFDVSAEDLLAMTQFVAELQAPPGARP